MPEFLEDWTFERVLFIFRLIKYFIGHFEWPKMGELILFCSRVSDCFFVYLPSGRHMISHENRHLAAAGARLSLGQSSSITGGKILMLLFKIVVNN